MNPPDSKIKEILTQYKNITIIGLSHQEKRPSHHVGKYLQDNGYKITGIRPAGPDSILGEKRYASLEEAPKPFEIVDVFRASEFIPSIVDDVISTGTKVLWLQEGVSHADAEKKAREHGILVISDLCIKKAHAKLFQ